MTNVATTNGHRLTAFVSDGLVTLEEEAVPPLGAGHVEVEVHRSLISPGSELGGWHHFGQNGRASKPERRPFGYSNAGIVRRTGAGVRGFKAGDRVAAIGAGIALHSTVAVVPQNLCVAIPDSVTFEQASYGMLAATALHAVRRAQPEFGEQCAVFGLGLLGHLTAMLLQLDGCRVIGVDPVRARRDRATSWGIDGACFANGSALEEGMRCFTGGQGLDFAVFALSGDAGDLYTRLVPLMRTAPDSHAGGRVVLVGHMTFPLNTKPMSNMDIRFASRTGPGYHDHAWEAGNDYPEMHVRWTTRSNLELCMRLIAEKRLPVDTLTTHRMPLAGIETALPEAAASPDDMLGVILEMT